MENQSADDERSSWLRSCAGSADVPVAPS